MDGAFVLYNVEGDLVRTARGSGRTFNDGLKIDEGSAAFRRHPGRVTSARYRGRF